jgi:hypothetical protein
MVTNLGCEFFDAMASCIAHEAVSQMVADPTTRSPS